MNWLMVPTSILMMKSATKTEKMDFPTWLNGWTIYAHPCFIDQYNALVARVEDLKHRFPDPIVFQKKKETKVLAHLLKSIANITHEPRASVYRPGDSIGKAYTDWSRAKFGGGRYRLFFRYSLESKIIVIAWVNDEGPLRTYGSKTEAYKIFGKMLDEGNPPDDWLSLLQACQNDGKEHL